MKDLHLTPNPVYNSIANKREGLLDERSVPHICPIIGLEMSGKFPFVALWTCGCVMSERAIKEIKAKTCPKVRYNFLLLACLPKTRSPKIKVNCLPSKLRFQITYLNHLNKSCPKIQPLEIL